MKQILHIFAKDARHFWVEILISVALAATFAWINPSTWTSGHMLYASAEGRQLQVVAVLLNLLIPVGWWLLIARIVYAEALVGDRQFWLTRPYEWKKLLAAKLLFLLVFLYLPLLIAQCLLLVQAGFHPVASIPGLLFNLLLITGILVLPVFAIATVVSTFARLTLTLLAGLAIFVAYLAVSLSFSNDAGIPVHDHLFPGCLAVCATVVVVQYATRRVQLARLILIGLPVLLILVSLAVPESTVIAHNFSAVGAAEPGPLQMALQESGTRRATADVLRDRKVHLSLPVQVSGVTSGYAITPNYLKVTIEAADGRHWTSPWQGADNSPFLPGSSNAWLSMVVDRAFFEQVQGTPVTLHFTFALTQVRAGETRTVALPTHDFAVPDFGICSPRPSDFGQGFSGIGCRFALHEPSLTYISVHWSNGPCAASVPAPAGGLLGDDWVGTLETAPADFGITSVRSPQMEFSNSTKGEGETAEPRYLCPGTPVTFTQYDLVQRLQSDVTIPNIRLPSYRNNGDGGSSVGFTLGQ